PSTESSGEVPWSASQSQAKYASQIRVPVSTAIFSRSIFCPGVALHPRTARTNQPKPTVLDIPRPLSPPRTCESEAPRRRDPRGHSCRTMDIIGKSLVDTSGPTRRRAKSKRESTGAEQPSGAGRIGLREPRARDLLEVVQEPRGRGLPALHRG